ncbi:MAG: hypothetical protein LBQ90_04585, partial [Synergistaceae bacterium]|nr:hypothetical protein [Synergistaceae bacterium]
AYSIQQTRDGGYVVAGYTSSADGDVSGFQGGWSDCWVVKLNATGSIEWQKAFGGSDFDTVTSIQQTIDGGYIVAGNTVSTDGDVSSFHGKGKRNIWVVKLNAKGSIEWQKTPGGSRWSDASSIQQTTDSGYIVAGYTSSADGDVSGFQGGWSDCWMVKLNAKGSIEWQKALGGSDRDEARSIQQTADGGYIVAGWTESTDGDVSGSHGSRDAWVVKLK